MMMNQEKLLQLKMKDEVHFGKDVLIEILLYLPIKSLMRFKCISKYWYALIKHPTFPARHLEHDCRDQILLVKRCLPPQNYEANLGIDDDMMTFHDLYCPENCEHICFGGDDVLSFHDLNDPDLLVSPDLLIPFFKDVETVLHRCVLLLGPCNGLVCVSLNETMILCNPALREFKLLAPSPFACPEGYITIYMGSGFGFDPNTNGYKFIQMWDIVAGYEAGCAREERYKRIYLYNSSTDSWKHIDAVLPSVMGDGGSELLFNGVYHWMTIEYIEGPPPMRVILSFNMSTDVFHKLEYPNMYYDPKFESLATFNQCLSLVRYQRWTTELHLMEIWIMKEYGVKDSWTKELVIGPYLFRWPLLCCENEWLLVETNDSQLASCTLHANQTKGLQFHGQQDSFQALSIKESLISVHQVLPGDTLSKEGATVH